MGWLDRLFPGSKKKQNAPAASAPAAKPSGGATIPPEKVGLDGEFDESGLAKRVALAFDQDPQLDDVGTLWVAQLGSKVVLKGKVPSQDYLNKATSIAKGVKGATEVDASQVTVG
ncbi:BON domain-containing protein [Thermocoleostomius sinensis]|jgi:osmotically-inducible protein OsmY|uniref:BON domain-containing protein n=1 Tax=Thermocoleostomius sinensis A174 TaxID=2016057 RepID=A0A9E8ZEY0_9CYAN|nr:BON domain-containing protein [Thermocoleostomius sinensis]WAL62124.1 BON domain-containing protein [Thermocoleostomius sinensis A174]